MITKNVFYAKIIKKKRHNVETKPWDGLVQD